jgi:hypothetical protein
MEHSTNDYLLLLVNSCQMQQKLLEVMMAQYHALMQHLESKGVAVEIEIDEKTKLLLAQGTDRATHGMLVDLKEAEGELKRRIAH